MSRQHHLENVPCQLTDSDGNPIRKDIKVLEALVRTDVALHNADFVDLKLDLYMSDTQSHRCLLLFLTIWWIPL